MFSDNMGPSSDSYWQAQKVDRIRELHAALSRVCDCLATFIRESPDPGTEALAALDEARRLL
jgi:hypothetical protein